MAHLWHSASYPNYFKLDFDGVKNKVGPKLIRSNQLPTTIYQTRPNVRNQICPFGIKPNMDTNLQVWSRAYATRPDFRLTYFLSEVSWGQSHLCEKTVSKHKYTCFSLKLSQLIMGLVPNFPQIKVSGVKINFMKLVMLLLQLQG